MKWNVKNALSRDVEREHLNKILAEISTAVGDRPTSQTVSNTVTTVVRQAAASAPPPFPIQNIKVTLQGDVTGTGQATAAGQILVEATVDPSILGIPDVPDTGLPYWRVADAWNEVPINIVNLGDITDPGFMAMDEDGYWYAREVEGTAGQIVVTDGSGVDGNPTIGLAAVADSGTGVGLVKITRDAYGRVTGQQAALLEDVSDVDITGRLNGYTIKWDSVSSTWVMAPLGGVGTAAWGGITGTLSDQIDLQDALDAKMSNRKVVEAGETIFGERAVRIENGLLYHPDPSDPTHATQVIGISTQSGSAGTDINVAIFGDVTEGSWTWASGFVYVSTGGVLTQSPSSSGWLLSIGRATSSTTIGVDVDTPFMRN